MPSINVGTVGSVGIGCPRFLFTLEVRRVNQAQTGPHTDHTRLDFILFDLQGVFLPTIVVFHMFCCVLVLGVCFACHNVYSGSSLIVQDWRWRDSPPHSAECPVIALYTGVIFKMPKQCSIRRIQIGVLSYHRSNIESLVGTKIGTVHHYS